MTSPWQMHDEAKGHAIGEMRDLVDFLRQAKERAQEVAGVVANVTGGELCPNEEGRQAFGHMARAVDMIDEVAQAVNVAIDHMGRYIF